MFCNYNAYKKSFDFCFISLYTLVIMKLKYIIEKSNKYETIKQILKEEFFLSERLIKKSKSNLYKQFSCKYILQI